VVVPVATAISPAVPDTDVTVPDPPVALIAITPGVVVESTAMPEPAATATAPLKLFREVTPSLVIVADPGLPDTLMPEPALIDVNGTVFSDIAVTTPF
jgi:hypothetical protein